MENLEINLKKPHASVLVLGDEKVGKSTLTSAITKVLSLRGEAEFVKYEKMKK